MNEGHSSEIACFQDSVNESCLLVEFLKMQPRMPKSNLKKKGLAWEQTTVIGVGDLKLHVTLEFIRVY